MMHPTHAETPGIDEGRLRSAFALLQGWLDDGVVGAVASVVLRGGAVAGSFYGGREGPGGSGRAVDEGSLFHLASIGKPMTALAAMQFVEAGAIALDDPVASVLPALAGEGRDGITLRHLLSHTSGLPQDLDLSGLPAGAGTAEQLRTCLRARLVAPVGSKVEYSNVGYGLLGLVVEALGGRPFADHMRERVFAPAGMADSHLAPEGRHRERIVHVAGTPDAGSPYERWNSDHARSLANPAGSVIGTPLDVARFFQALLDGGRGPAGRLVAPATARLMVTSQTDGLRGGIEGFMTWDDCAWGLGFDLRGSKRPHFSGEYTSPGTFGHTGVAGTFAWADPASGLVCVMLAGRMLYNRWNESRWSRFSTAVSAALEE